MVKRILFVDISHDMIRNGLGVVLILPIGLLFEYNIWLNYNISNNEVKYEALIQNTKSFVSKSRIDKNL